MSERPRAGSPGALPIAFAVLLVLGGSALTPGVARAGGFFLGDRGVRGTGRAGALIAGADAPDSLWYNPAGLAWSGRQLQLDATLVLPDHEFTRIDGGGEWQPTVRASGIPVPIPGLFYSDNFGLRDWTFGVGAFAPTAVLEKWPETVTIGGVTEPSPERYSVLSLEGTVLAHLAVGAAWRPLPALSIGATAQLIGASFRIRSVISGCDRAFCTQPENPDFDALADVNLSQVIAATFGAGVIYDAGFARFGASFLTPYTLSGDATITVRLPSAAAFDSARIEGNKASTSLAMPWILRAGVEVRPLRGLRVEAAIVAQLWSTQQAMTITPHDIWLRNVLALGDYEAGPVTVPRGMRDTLSLRLGGEYTTGILGVRAGFAYENGAFDDAYLSPLTIDSDNATLALGVSVEVTRGLSVDVSYQHFFMRNRQVRNSAVPQANPVRPPPADPIYVGNGDYVLEADTLGIGLRWQIDAPPSRSTETAEAATDATPEPAPTPPTTAAAPTPPGHAFAWPRATPAPTPAVETPPEADEPPDANPYRTRTPRPAPRRRRPSSRRAPTPP